MLGVPADPSTRCFLCWRTQGDGVTLTREHIVPRWAQKRFLLKDAPSLLPNGTQLSYSSRVIPACRDCNQWLSQTVEQPMARALRQASERPDEMLVLLWLAKIYYATRWQECFLSADRADPHSTALRQPNDLHNLGWLRLLLLAGQTGLTTATALASILVFPTVSPTEREHRWDLFIPSDAFGLSMISVRAEGWMMVAVFGDSGYLADTFPDVSGWIADQGGRLHPIQCREVFARVEFTLMNTEIFARTQIQSSGRELPGELMVRLGASVTIAAPEVNPDEWVAAWNEHVTTFLADSYGFEGLDKAAEDLSAEGAQFSIMGLSPDRLWHATTCREMWCPEFLKAAGFAGPPGASCEMCDARLE